MTPPVILTIKIRHLNSRQMVSIPEQCVTVRHPVLKAPPGEMRHTAELVNRPPADQPPRQITLHLQPPVGFTQPGQTTGVAVDQRHNLTVQCLPAASPPAPSGNTPPAHRRYSRRENIFPLPAFSPRSRTTPLAHIAGRAPESLILSVSWDYCESLLMERKPPKLPTLLRNLQPLRHLLHLSFVISDVGWSYSSATAGP